jgi:hypothetical protein
MQQDMEIDLNLDPLEAIINPVHPPAGNDFIDLNDFIEEVEENIPQQQAAPQNHEHENPNLMQVDVEVNQPMEVEGFPVPPLQDLLGDEIPLD